VAAIREIADRGRRWFETPPDRDVTGKAPPELKADAKVHRWARWRGSVTRIADLATTLQEVLTAQSERPIRVTWSAGFTHCYSPREFAERIEESRLSQAELIEIVYAQEGRSAKVRLSKQHGEPGAELLVEGGEWVAAFDRLKGAVELGEWRPWSGERIASAGGFVMIGAVTVMGNELIGTITAGEVLMFIAILVGAVALGFLYGFLATLVLNFLLPPLEIRRDGVQALNVLSGALRWTIGLIPAGIAAATVIAKVAG
jgi:hypothetical protein